MSSSAILGEIQACENKISMKTQEIVKLNEAIEAQEYAIRALGTKANGLFDELGEKDGKIGSIAAHIAKAVFSVRFGEGMETEYRGKKPTASQAIEEMGDGMRRELRETVDELDSCEQELSRLKSRLSSLYAEYNAALAYEEAERQAMAAAALMQ